MSTNGERRVFGDRYEIQSKIARGGMADVYLARDQLLDRPVALKVLFAELSVDPSFVERFRREAQNAAKLSHPNIVSVYDWGEDDNTYYIVMEYIGGRSLSALLREDGPLDAERAAVIGAEVASALSFAHRNGVVHRDVKPGNVLLDDSGAVKVTDFGIARARNTTENLTQTGAVMGTATYFSPEQAQGLTVDQRSDVYSLGVVLYEMAAGQAPFTGDNPVTIAYKHVREQPTPLRQLNPKVPAPYESIVAEALAKSPANRYQTAEDLRADLVRFQRHQPIHATAVAPPDEATRAERRTQVAAAAAYGASNPPPRQPLPDPKLPKDDSTKSIAGPLIGMLILLAILGIGAIIFLTDNALTNGERAEVSVPNVVGKSQQDAQRDIENAKLRSQVSTEESDETTGTVTAQDPGANATAREGDTVRLTVSAGPAPVRLSDYTGQSADAATRALRALGFNVSTTQASSNDVDEGRVISQNPPAGQQLSKGGTVTLTVSTGPQQVEVPDVVGFTQSTAAQELGDAGLRTAATTVPSDQPAGTVISTDPSAGTEVDKGATVTITVSGGQPTTTTAPGQATTTTRRGNSGGNGNGGNDG